MVLALLVLSFVSGGPPLKTLAMVLTGLLISTIGVDLITAYPRFTFGQIQFTEGISFVAIALGLFGVSEILINLEEIAKVKVIKPTLAQPGPAAQGPQGFGAGDRPRHGHRVRVRLHSRASRTSSRPS